MLAIIIFTVVYIIAVIGCLIQAALILKENYIDDTEAVLMAIIPFVPVLNVIIFISVISEWIKYTYYKLTRKGGFND